MKTIEFSGKIEEGKMIIFNRDVVLQEIQEIGFVNHFHATLEYGNKRTLKQNNYLYGAVIKTIRLRLRQEGYKYTNSEVKNYLENKFCRTEELNHETGGMYSKTMALKELSTDQFENIVIGDIRNWCEQSLGSYILMPHEYYLMTPTAYDKWKRGEINRNEAVEMSKDDPMVKKIKEMFG